MVRIGRQHAAAHDFEVTDSWCWHATPVPGAGVLPMFGVDLYQAGHGRMRGKLLGMITVADGSGAEFDLGELTTYVNDALMLAPSMLLTPAITWRAVDDDSFDVSMSEAQSRRPHGSMSMSRAAWSTSAPPIAGQLSRAG